MSNKKGFEVDLYATKSLVHLKDTFDANQSVLHRLAVRLVKDVKNDKKLFVFGSGHSSILAFELYHRAGGASFIIPIVGDFLLPTAGPPVVRVLERTSGVVAPLLARAEPQKGEMIWIASQSGINAASIEMALEAQKRGMYIVGFTSVAHSKAVTSRHSSGKKLFQLCDEVVDLGGVPGDALMSLNDARGSSLVRVGPVSTLTSVYLAHSILVSATSKLEAMGVHCVYTSVNTPEGERRNRDIEAEAMSRDPLLR